MILSDSEILRNIKQGNIGFQLKEGYKLEDQIGPASLDFRLGNEFKIYDQHVTDILDPMDGTTIQRSIRKVHISDGDFFVLHPNQFVLGVTAEIVKVPTNMVARCEGRSSLGRLGLIIHSTAGFLDPGFEGTITLEITNINQVPIKLYPSMRIGQYAFETILGEVITPYNMRQTSKYMHQSSPEESKISQDFENVKK